MLKRLLQICLFCLAGFTMLGASDPNVRFDRLGHQLMCTCGCGEILLECNHVGCPNSGPMITELHNLLGSGSGAAGSAGSGLPGAAPGGNAVSMTNAAVLNWFASKYGPIVLAAPIRGGFDLVAWIMPFAVLALGIAALFYFARIWKERHQKMTAGAPQPLPAGATSSLRDRIRNETTYDA